MRYCEVCRRALILRMATYERDYILRAIRAAALAVARLRERLMGSGSAQEVVEAAQQAQGELFGPRWPILSALDAASAAQLIGDERHLDAWTDLLKVEADAERRLGNEPRATRLEQRAAELRAAATHRAY